MSDQQLDGAQALIKTLDETKPLQQWGVTGELRKRIKIAFDREGIEIPFPQRDFHLRSVDDNISIVKKEKES